MIKVVVVVRLVRWSAGGLDHGAVLTLNTWSDHFERLGRFISLDLFALGCNQHLVLQLFDWEYPLRALVAGLAWVLCLRLLLRLRICFRHLALLDLHILLLLLNLLLVEKARRQSWLGRVLRLAGVRHVPVVFSCYEHFILLDWKLVAEVNRSCCLLLSLSLLTVRAALRLHLSLFHTFWLWINFYLLN